MFISPKLPTNRKNFWLFSSCLTVAVMFESFLYYWRSIVNPSPDYQYPEFFSNFINYLVISQYIGNDWNIIIRLGFESDYPLGFALYPWLISGWGLQELFIHNPWLWNLSMTIPLALIPVFTNWNKKQTIYYFLIIFFCPSTQVMLKSFNPQGPIIIYTLCALALLIRILNDNRKTNLIAFFIFSWLAISIKHMGAFYFVIIFMVLISWKLLRYQKPFKDIWLAILIALACLPAYPLDGLKFYLSHVITSHNPFLSMWAFLTYLALSFIIVMLILLTLRKKQGKQEFPDFFSSGYFISVCLFAWFVVTWAPISQLQFVIASAVMVISMFVISIHLITKYDCSTIKALKGLMAFYLLSFSTAIYLSLVGHTPYIFILPICFSIFLYIEQNQFSGSARYFLIAFILMSNFFPSQNTLQQYFKEGDYYARLFSTEIQNPLGWQVNPLKAAREDLIKILESYEYTDLQYQKGIKLASVDIDLEMFAFFYNVQNHFPIIDSNKLLDETIFRNNLDKVLNQNFDFMNDQLESGQIPVLMYRSIEPSEIQSSMIEAIDDLQKNVSPDTPFWSMEEDLLNLMVMHLNLSPQISKNYHKHVFKMETQTFEVLVHKKIKQRKIKPHGPNYYLLKLLKNIN